MTATPQVSKRIQQCTQYYHTMQQLPQQPHPKSSLCRYYLRGLCILPDQECPFAHGIKDIIYRKWAGEPVEYDHLQSTPFCQRETVKGPRNYLTLFQTQSNPQKHSLEEINSNREVRVKLRTQLHQRMFDDFMHLLEEQYPEANLTESMIEREYFRLGFNKLMTRIKFSHITAYLTQGTQPKYFQKTTVMPPLVSRNTSYMVCQASEEETLEVYREQYRLARQEGIQDEATLKKRMVHMNLPYMRIPPPITFMQQRKIGFTQLLAMLQGATLDELLQDIKLQATPQDVLKEAIRYLESEEGRGQLHTWNDLYVHLCKACKLNNANTINQVKPLLAAEGYWVLSLPVRQFLMYPALAYSFESARMTSCPCPYKTSFDISDVKFITEVDIDEGVSVDIANMESLLKYGAQILGSKVLGVDLQGNLRRHGYIQMIQLNNGRNTFLIDFYYLAKQQDHATIQLIKKVLRNTMTNPQCLKIFHDCRHDLLALHRFTQTCVLNVFDTSAVETLIVQLEKYERATEAEIEEKERKKRVKEAVTASTNSQSFGLNDILRKYDAAHGINQHKDKFHGMWKRGENKYFDERPLHPDYREYCIKDVLDLPQIYLNMLKKLPTTQLQDMAYWASSLYVQHGYQHSLDPQN